MDLCVVRKLLGILLNIDGNIFGVIRVGVERYLGI
jgi:hypothetical protein